jgi:hypothetical protein
MIKYSLTHPLYPEIMDRGEITQEAFRELFDHFPWVDTLKELGPVTDSNVFHSPSITLTDTVYNRSLTICVAGTEADLEFFLFYKRPRKTVDRYDDSVKVFNPAYLSVACRQSLEDIETACDALFEGNGELLEERWGSYRHAAIFNQF